MLRSSCIRVLSRLALAAVVVSGCSEGGGGPPIDPDPPGGTLTDLQREAAFAAVQTRLTELTGANLSPDDFNQALRQWLSSRAEFEAAGVDESSSVWARFTDGRLLIIANNREPGQPDEGALSSTVAQQMLAMQRVAASASASGQLPIPKQVRLLHSFGPGFEQVQAPVRDLADWFSAAGYTVVSGQEGDARVDVLRNVSGDGFFYFNTHGGKGKTRDGREVFAVQTSSLATRATDNLPDFKEDLDNGRLVYLTAKNGGKIVGGLVDDWDTRYAITYLFVEKYMSFGENSVVFFNVCFSGNAHSDISSFIFAAHKKGAGFYLGWTESVSASPAFAAVRYFVDRMLGGNRYRAEDPRQRPFDLDAVLEEMRSKGLTRDASTGAELVAKPAAAGTNSLLAPTIYALQPGADGLTPGVDEVAIHGRFGPDPGASERSVTIAGQEMAIQEWTPERITVSIPRSGTGSSGDVVVTVRGRKSNPRALVAWRGRMRYTLRGGGTLIQTVEFDLHLRGDPDRARQRPGEAPEGLPNEFWVHAIQDATGSFSVSGSRTYFEPDDPSCPYTEEWSGSGTMQYGANAAALPGWSGFIGFVYGGPVDADSRIINLRLSAWAPQTLRVFAFIPDVCDSDTGIIQTGFWLPIELTPVPLALDSSFNIRPGKIERQIVGPFSFERISTATLEWQAIPAQPGGAADQQK